MEWLTELINQHGLGLGLLAVFVGGLALNLTPCVYPMIPVTLAFFSRQAAFTRARSGDALRRAILLAGCYVLGISLNYAVLGMVAAKTGALFGFWLQQPVVLLVIAGIVVALSLSMFGWYDVRLPSSLTQRFNQSLSGAGGAFVMGLLVGVIAAPCIGPFILSLLLVVGRIANPAIGFLLFFALGLGMGLPYLVLGVAAERVNCLPKAGPWLVWSKAILGVVLLGLALYFLKPLLSARLFTAAVVMLLGGSGLYLGWLQRLDGRSPKFTWVRRAIGAGLIVAALAWGWPKPASGPPVAWVPYSGAALQQAQRERRAVLIDVYADWCAPCVEMDHFTFRHPEVVKALTEFSTLRLDVTSGMSADGERLVEAQDVFGAPTILFFDRSGAERRDLRLMGFVPPQEFLQHLRRLQ